jgi:YD repeat-containing protein
MKRVILAVCALALAAGPALAEDRKTGWDEDGLEGKVRSVRAETTTVGKPSERSTRTTRYESDGRRIEWIRYDAAGKVKDRTTYAYTPKGVLSELRYSGANSVLETRSTFVFDGRGLRTEIANLDAKGAIKDKTTSVYDGRGREVEATRTAADGAVLERVVYGYDAKDRVSEESHYDGTGAPTKVVRYVYDDHGHPTAETSYDGHGATTAKETWSNDDDGNKMEWTIFNTDGSVKERWRYDYKFDKTGNWTMRTASRIEEKGGKETTVPTYVTKRTIVYY